MSSELSDPRWYVAFSKPRQEELALEQLLNQGFQTYLPQMPEWKRSGGTWKHRTVPIFPRYLFVRPAHDEQSIAPVRSTYGLTGLVRFGVEFARVRPVLISSIHQLEVQLATLRARPPGEDLPQGSEVQIVEGPFAGLQAVVHASARDRVIVLLDIVGRETRVKLERAAVAPL